MAKVLLVNTALAYSNWNADLETPSPDSVFIRLGLAYIGGALKARGHEVALVDLRMLSGWDHYVEKVREASPDFIGISIHSVEFSIAVEAARQAKKAIESVTIVAGGIHPTMFPLECLETGVFDYVIQGEGEVSMPDLVEDPSRFPDHFWGETPDLDKVPFPDREIWSDYGQRIYAEPFGIANYKFPLPMAELINVRGCPYNCSFCCGPGEHQLYTKITNSGKRVPNIRGRSVENVISELEMLIERYGIRSAMFHDDQFIVSPGWVKKFLSALHSSGIVKSGFKWVTSSRADIICNNEELIGEMSNAGLELLIVGFESFSPRILEWFHKGIKVDQNFRAAEICKKYDIKLWANYILGVRTDTGWHKEDDMITVAGALKVNPVHFSPAFYTPVPGSKLFDFYKDNKLIENDYTSIEDLSNRGKMAAKIKGVDYDFLTNIMITDAVFATDSNIQDAMQSYSPEMNDMDPLEYIERKSVDAASGIINVLRTQSNGLLDERNQIISEAHDAINIARNNEKESKDIIKNVLEHVVELNMLASKAEVQKINSRVSVVIPVKNGGSRLNYLLQKLRKQKRVSDIEIIIVDSGSTDNTLEIAQLHGARVIEILPDQFNHGTTRQLGVNEATGEYVFMTVHDAYPTSDYFLYKMVKTLIDDPEIAVVSARQTADDETDLYSRWVLHETYSAYNLSNDMSYRLKYPDIFGELPVSIKRQISFIDDVCACYRASVIKEAGFSRLSNAEDVDLGVRLIKQGHTLSFLDSARMVHWHGDGPDYFAKRHFNGVKSFVEILDNNVRDLALFHIYRFDDVRDRCAFLYHAVRLALQQWQTNGVLNNTNLMDFAKKINYSIRNFSEIFLPDNLNDGGNQMLHALLEDLGCSVRGLMRVNLSSQNHLLNEFSGQFMRLSEYMLCNYKTLQPTRTDFVEAVYKIVAALIGDVIGNWVMKLKQDGRESERNEIIGLLSKGVCYK